MKRAIITVFLFGAALFGTNTLVSAHPGHGGGPGHTHGPAHLHGHSHNHGGVIIYSNSFGNPYNTFYYGQPVIIHGGHLHGGAHLHGPYNPYYYPGGLQIQTGGYSFGIRY